MSLRRLLAVTTLLLLVSSLASAQAEKSVIYRAREAFSTTQTVPCLGTVNIEAILFTRITEWTNPAGMFFVNYHTNFSQFRAVDANGTEYSGAQEDNYTYHVASDGFPLEEIEVMTLRGQSHGSAPDILIKSRYHLTINAPGDVTASWELFSVTCTGK